MILIVGATGQLGSAVTRELVNNGQKVRALVRSTSSAAYLKVLGVDLVTGDLRDTVSVRAACQGVNTIIATANVVIRRAGDDFRSVEGTGYQNLIDSAKQQGVGQFIYASVAVTPIDDKVLPLKYKRLNEQRLQDSGLNYTIVRMSVFMDVWLALLGSQIPTRGAESPTVERPFWFSKFYLGMIGRMIDDRGIAIVPGSGKTRHAFIAVRDVARFLARCVGHPQATRTILHLGGPQVLSWDEALDVFGQVLGKKIRPVHVPIGIFKANNALLKPFAEGPAAIMGMNWMTGSADSAYPTTDADRILGQPLMTMHDFLAQKIELPRSH